MRSRTQLPRHLVCTGGKLRTQFSGNQFLHDFSDFPQQAPQITSQENQPVIRKAPEANLARGVDTLAPWFTLLKYG